MPNSYLQSLTSNTDAVPSQTLGFGNGASAAVDAPAKGTGSGPATPGTIVQWLSINVAGTTYWIPLAQ